MSTLKLTLQSLQLEAAASSRLLGGAAECLCIHVMHALRLKVHLSANSRRGRLVLQLSTAACSPPCCRINAARPLWCS